MGRHNSPDTANNLLKPEVEHPATPVDPIAAAFAVPVAKSLVPLLLLHKSAAQKARTRAFALLPVFLPAAAEEFSPLRGRQFQEVSGGCNG